MLDVAELLARFGTDLLARPSGPLGFRFFVQPLMAMLLAMRDGVGDARSGRSPYFWTVLHDAAHHAERLAEGLKATAKVIVLGVLIDAAYQMKVHGSFYAGEALLIALLLGFVPYLLIRGPVDRIARRWIANTKSRREAPQPPARTT